MYLTHIDISCTDDYHIHGYLLCSKLYISYPLYEINTVIPSVINSANLLHTYIATHCIRM